MKICSLKINSYKQFKDLELNLTYPIGHEKEGQALDKICIIGQSGTGKTNLLNIIKKSVVNFSELRSNSYLPFHQFSKNTSDASYITSKFTTQKNSLCETLFTNTASKITSAQDIKLLESEKKYFVGTDKTSYTSSNNQIKMTDSDRILLKGFNEHRKNIIKNGMEIYGVNGFENELKSIDLKILTLNKKYNTVSESIKQLKSENFIDRNIIDINAGNHNIFLIKTKQ